jgi:hypothetical protein
MWETTNTLVYILDVKNFFMVATVVPKLSLSL